MSALAGLGQEATDEEATAKDHDADKRISISRDAWMFVVRSDARLKLLAVAERDGLDDAHAQLTARGPSLVRGPLRLWTLIRGLPIIRLAAGRTLIYNDADVVTKWLLGTR